MATKGKQLIFPLGAYEKLGLLWRLAAPYPTQMVRVGPSVGWVWPMGCKRTKSELEN